MTARQSAGLLLYRKKTNGPEVFLVHMGGPFWAKKDKGAWTIPKGVPEAGEDLLTTANREFQEETGAVVTGRFIELEPVKQKGGKTVYAWAVESDCDPATFKCNAFTLEWPPKSGQYREFPEADKAAWFLMDEAKEKIISGQVKLLEELVEKLK